MYRENFMRVIILRHGISEETHPQGDNYRRLTPEGRVKLERVAEFLSKRIRPDMVLTSPFVRAVQTAEVFCKALEYRNSIAESHSLEPACSPDSIIEEISVLDEGEVLLVGHDPHLSSLIERMVCSGNLNFNMKKAAVVRIDFDHAVRAGEGELKWAVAPGIIGA